MEMMTVYTPWAIRNGWRCPFFMNVYFEKHLTAPIKEIQKTLNLMPLPDGSLQCDIWNY
jgi:ubiquinone biosynthesis protein Coq4